MTAPANFTGGQLEAARQRYWGDEWTIARIGSLIEACAATVRKQMIQNRIPRRGRSAASALAAQQRSADNRAAIRRVLADHNARRTEEAAPVQVARVRAALAALGDQTPPLYAQAARLRIDRPADSLTELAAHAAVTKHVLAGRLRRLLALAEPAANGH